MFLGKSRGTRNPPPKCRLCPTAKAAQSSDPSPSEMAIKALMARSTLELLVDKYVILEKREPRERDSRCATASQMCA